MKYSAFLLMLLMLFGCMKHSAGPGPYDFADPMIGTGGTGHTFPGATLPFGMIQLSPSNDFKGWNWCSGYHYSDSIIKGFAHNHISGPGLAGLGDILVTATSGEPNTNPGTEEDPDSGYRSRFSHNHEIAIPGYYSVHLDDYNVDAELTCTERTGLHRYTFNEAGIGNIIIDPTHRIMESLFESALEVVNDREVRGYKYSEGEAGRRRVFFHARFSQPFETFGLTSGGEVTGSHSVKARECAGWFSFSGDSLLVVEVRVGLSFTGYEGALMNLEEESARKGFYDVRELAAARWREVLGRIEVSSDDPALMKNFYTAMYHAFQSPNIISDIDGRYSLDETLYDSDIPQYSRYSTWDTYRALHPLFTIIEQSRTAMFVNSLASRHRVTGDGLPVWELCGHDNVCMIGYSPASVMAEAIVKDIPGIDSTAAYEAIRASAFNTGKVSPNSGPSGLAEYILTGYVPSGINQSVSKTTEYGYHDWAISRAAKHLGYESDQILFRDRSFAFRHHFNEGAGYLWPKSATGEWTEMDTTIWDDLISHYISGNIWGYSSYVPHAMPELIELYGGPEAYSRWLDHIMTDTTTIGGSQHVDISGFIGKYGHGDEPTHQMPWLYTYTGRPWRTAEIVREVLATMYHPEPDGLVNNDDLGQMSAWYIFSSIGLYPVSPVDREYILGSPIFEQASIHLPEGKSFIIKARGTSPKKKYVRSVKLNGQKLSRAWITHDEIIAGGTLEFRMSGRPGRDFGTDPSLFPGIVPFERGADRVSETPFAPFDTLSRNIFFGRASIELFCNTPGAHIQWSVQDGDRHAPAITYSAPLEVDRSITLEAVALKEGRESIPWEREIFVSSLPVHAAAYLTVVPDVLPEGYGEGRPWILADRVTGSNDFADGTWAGFNGKDVTLTMDFGEPVSVWNISVGSMVKTISWIFPPSSITILTETINGSWEEAGGIETRSLPDQAGPYVDRYLVEFSPRTTERLKIVIRNYGEMPYWHGASGTRPWLFIDEIIPNLKR